MVLVVVEDEDRVGVCIEAELSSIGEIMVLRVKTASSLSYGTYLRSR